jgi:hypothetical protein
MGKGFSYCRESFVGFGTTTSYTASLMASITREFNVVLLDAAPGKPVHPIRYGKRKTHT